MLDLIFHPRMRVAVGRIAIRSCFTFWLLFSAGGAEAAEPAAAQPNWPALKIPKALVAVGVWGELFQWRAALQQQGIEYDECYRAQNAYHRPLVQMHNMPSRAEDFRKYSTIVLINIDAPALGKERLAAIEQFVTEGGGLVVLGGFWAYGRGMYADTPLAKLLPVEIPAEGTVPQDRAGALLAAPKSSWNLPAEFSAQPRAFYFHHLQPRSAAEVVLTVGEQPAIVAGETGAGRAVACALTVNGLAPQGTLPFWEWKDWPAVLGQCVEWAGARRPLPSKFVTAAAGEGLTKDELEQLWVNGFQAPSAEQLDRFAARPTPAAAETVFTILITENKGPAELKPEWVAALAGQAKAEWAAPLLKMADGLNPNLAQRRTALELLGATRAPEAAGVLLKALNDPDIAVGAAAGLSRLGSAAQLPALRKVLTRSLSSADFRNYGEDQLTNASAGVQGQIALAAALALYRLGDADALAQLLQMHRELRLLRRVYFNAAKRRVVDTDPTGIALRNAIYKKANDFAALEQQLLREIGPVPEAQQAAFEKLAAGATDEADVLLLAAALHRSPGNWPGLAAAQCGTLRRLAAAMSTKQ